MALSPMRYGDYVWPHNPRVYEVEFSRRILSHKVPFGLYTMTDLGRDHRVLRGEGEFVGEGAYEEFKKLANMFYLNEPAVLTHPVWQSARAWFVSLRVRQEPREDYVSYEFEFWECFEGYTQGARLVSAPQQRAQAALPSPAAEARKSYTVRGGDTMWAIARAHGLTLAQLVALNPQVRNPNLIHAGDILTVS